MNNDFPQSETDRRLSGMLMFGTVEAVDHDNARVRVRAGEWISDWLPWNSLAAGEVRHWRPPSIGEQVIILSPSGRPEQAGVIPGFYTTQHAAPSNDDKTVLWELPCGFQLHYPRGSIHFYHDQRRRDHRCASNRSELINMPAVARLGDLCTGHGCWSPRPSSSASPNVFVNGIPAHRQGDGWQTHCCPSISECHASILAEGSSTVFCNGLQLGRIGDPVACGSTVATGSNNVFAG
jgi:uncharacterized Zn-binding protein involved in type VI secretion